MSTTAYANEDVLRMQDLPDHVVMPSITYNGWNYSLLDQITLANVGDLTMVWTLSLGITDEYEAPPLVVGNVMYIIAPQDAAGLGPNEVLALDLTDEGRILWEFRPDVPDIAETRRVACCGDQTRGFHYAEGKLFMQTLDGQVFALDAGTGEALWRTQGVDLRIAETMTGTGGVFDGLYLTGNAGGEYGVRGKIAAYDINTGNLQYTMYNMGPDNEVGITPTTRPSTPTTRPRSPPGMATPGVVAVAPPGATSPTIRTLMSSTTRPAIAVRGTRTIAVSGASSISMRMAAWSTTATTGVPRRWPAMSPPAISSGRTTSPRPIRGTSTSRSSPRSIDLEIGGAMRQTAVKAARDGFFYVWDRANGELLIEPWMHIYTDIAPWREHGAPAARSTTSTSGPSPTSKTAGTTPRSTRCGTRWAPTCRTTTPARRSFYCPGTSARNWQNDAYSPRTGLLYTVVNTSCSRFRMIEGEYVPGQGWSLNQGAGTADRTWFDGEIITFQAQIQANNPLYNQDGAYTWPNAPACGTAWAITFEELTDAPMMATATDIALHR